MNRRQSTYLIIVALVLTCALGALVVHATEPEPIIHNTYDLFIGKNRRALAAGTKVYDVIDLAAMTITFNYTTSTLKLSQVKTANSPFDEPYGTCTFENNKVRGIVTVKLKLNEDENGEVEGIYGTHSVLTLTFKKLYKRKSYIRIKDIVGYDSLGRPIKFTKKKWYDE